MKNFYSQVMGFTVTDHGPHPDEHYLVMFFWIRGQKHHGVRTYGMRAVVGDYSAAQQLSFLLESLDELREMRDRLVAAGVDVNRYACHGNAWSIYFSDPEGNYLELYVHTPWYVPQPYGDDFDLDESNDEIIRKTEALCRNIAGFMMETDRKVKARETMLN
jgi:catechol 2,3-dioxygenase